MLRTLAYTTLPAIALSLVSSAFATEFSIDPAHSSVRFEVTHLGLATVDGKFKTFSGDFTFNEKDPAQSFGEATIEANSIDTSIDARDSHLKSPDFFNVEKFPTIVFKSKKLIGKGKNFKVIGDLTMHGVTKEITLNTKFLGTMKGMDGGVRAAFQAETSLNRFDYGLEWNKLVEAAPVVGKEVKIDIHIEANEKAAKK